MKWIDRWYVGSFTNSEKEYTVSLAEDGKTWGCSCPAWTFQRHRIRDGICKHIRQIQNLHEEDMLLKHYPKHYPDNVTHDDFFTEEEFTL